VYTQENDTVQVTTSYWLHSGWGWAIAWSAILYTLSKIAGNWEGVWGCRTTAGWKLPWWLDTLNTNSDGPFHGGERRWSGIRLRTRLGSDAVYRSQLHVFAGGILLPWAFFGSPDLDICHDLGSTCYLFDGFGDLLSAGTVMSCGLRVAGCGEKGHRAWRIEQDIARWKVQEDLKSCGLPVTSCELGRKGLRAKGIALSARNGRKDQWRVTSDLWFPCCHIFVDWLKQCIIWDFVDIER
jgi:hypothetical protein